MTIHSEAPNPAFLRKGLEINSGIWFLWGPSTGRAVSSVVEHSVDIAGVASSILAPRTIPPDFSTSPEPQALISAKKSMYITRMYGV